LQKTQGRIEERSGDIRWKHTELKKELPRTVQLTARSCGFLKVHRQMTVFDLSDVFGKPPPQLNFSR